MNRTSRPKRRAAPAAARSDDSRLLIQLGQRVRQARTAHAMSRRVLSERSGLSVRFLAQLEAGTGNISLRRLAILARALGLPLLQLMSAPIGPGAVRIALLGLRGAGKSTIGAALARRLRVRFIELDGLIEEGAGLALGQIFELHGERYFRRLERETLSRWLSEAEPGVVATGGGLVTDPDTYTLLRSTCTTVWLSARAEEHYDRVVAQGDRRPMANHPHAMAELRALLASRQDLYRMADLRVDTSALDVPRTVETILTGLGRPARQRAGRRARMRSPSA